MPRKKKQPVDLIVDNMSQPTPVLMEGVVTAPE
jgi:hypothetical protein